MHMASLQGRQLSWPYSVLCTGCVYSQPLLEKLKEKNKAVTDAIETSLLLMHKYCFSLGDVMETVVGKCDLPLPI